MKKLLLLLTGLALLSATALADAVTTFNSQYASITVNSTTGAIDLTMNPGWSLKIEDGQDFSVLCTGCGANTFGSLSVGFGANTVNSVVYGVDSGKTIGGLGVYTESLTGIGTGMAALQGTTSVNTLHLLFNATGVNITGFALHVCTGDGSNCGDPTFFAAVGSPAPTPEPASMLMFGSGLVAAGSVMRKRLRNLNLG